MSVVDFLRHGETERPGALLGRTDVPLSAAGWQQIERQTAGRTWSAIVSSPLIRARAAAEAIARSKSVALAIDPDWAEIDFGAWDGRDLGELRQDPQAGPALAKLYSDPSALAAPGGETYQDVERRVSRALHALGRREHDVLLVAHGGTIRTALSLMLDIPLAKLWSIRIDCATRIRVNLGVYEGHGLWGEILEIDQP